MTKRSALLVLLLAALFGAGGCAKGSPVGELDLFARDAAVTVDATAGDALHFRVDVSVDMNGLENASPRGALAVAALNRSQLTVGVRDTAGVSASATCPLKGNGTSQSKSGSKLSEGGLIVSCNVPITSTGKHVVTGTIAWDPAIKPLSGKLEVRLLGGGRR